MITYHTKNNRLIAELREDSAMISNTENILDIMGDIGFKGCSSVIIHAGSLHPNFFDLKTRLAGEILQKFSNYRMKLAVVGDFSNHQSKSLRDFIRESNRGKVINFVGTIDEALAIL
jgi:hypothetical protein